MSLPPLHVHIRRVPLQFIPGAVQTLSNCLSLTPWQTCGAAGCDQPTHTVVVVGTDPDDDGCPSRCQVVFACEDHQVHVLPVVDTSESGTGSDLECVYTAVTPET